MEKLKKQKLNEYIDNKIKKTLKESIVATNNYRINTNNARMYVSIDVVKKYAINFDKNEKIVHSKITENFKKRSDPQSYEVNIIFIKDDSYMDFPYKVAAKSGDYGFGLYLSSGKGLSKYVRMQIIDNFRITIDKDFPRKNSNFLKNNLKEATMFDVGDNIYVVDERLFGKKPKYFVSIILQNPKNSEMRSVTFKRGIENRYNRNKQSDINILWKLAEKSKGKVIAETKSNNKNRFLAMEDEFTIED